MTKKILVVDDEPAIGRLLMYQLQAYGYHVSYVSDGLLALQRLFRERPDLVLLDVMMPSISGWDVCRQIRACSTVPVIMLTAKSADPDIVTGLSAGADDYIAKPFSMAQVQTRIEAVLRRSHQPGARTAAEAYAKPYAPARSAVAAPVAPPQRPAPPAVVPSVEPAPERLGQRLRAERIARGLTLNQVEKACKIRWEFLQAVEQENFSYVPRTQLRTVLHTYASYLGLNLRELTGRSPQPQPFPLIQYATIVTVLLLVLAVGIYLL